MKKRIAILGSTGSIGTYALQVVRHLSDELCVTALAARGSSELLESQAREFGVSLVALWDKDKAAALQKRLPGRVLGGMEGMCEIAAHAEYDTLLVAMNSAEAILPTLAALERGRTVALASKEVLVAAGSLVMRLSKEKKALLVPVDSEHTALYQCMKGEKAEKVRRLIITASGGPFRSHTLEQLEKVTTADALKHPNYRMGAKVTIDSSTLMNKGLEMIEAHYLYNTPPEKIEIVIHPEQVIHSMAEFIDGSIMAQMSEPDMLPPIQYALTYPERQRGMLPPFDFCKKGALHFLPVDTEKFRCLELAYQSLRIGGSMPCYMNAASEKLVARFLNKEIHWLEIGRKLEQLMLTHRPEQAPDIEKILAIDAEARQQASIV